MFTNLDSEWKQFIPNFDYIYNNLGEISDKQIEVLNNKFLTASLLALKHTFQKEWLEYNALKMLVLTEGAPENLQKNFIVYLFERSKLVEGQIAELISSLPFMLKETIMSTLDLFIEKGKRIGIETGLQEGIEKGIKQGIEKGIEKGKADVIKNLLLNTDFNIAKIVALTDVSEDFVIRVQTENDIK